MATNQKKKSGAGNRSRSNNKKGNTRSNSRGNNRSTQQSSSSDGMTKILLILLCALIVVLIVINWTKDKEGEAEPTQTPYPTMAITPSNEPTETPVLTPTLEPTKKPENTPTEAPEATPTPTDIPDIPEPNVSIEEANGLMKQVVNLEGYSFEMSDDHLRMDEHVYYSYVIVHNEKEAGYAVLVDQADGSMYYYTEDGKLPLEFFPMDWNDTPDVDDTTVTVDRAKQWLSEINYTSMALPAPLADCTLELDAWKTVVSGVECYCLNVFYQGTLAGTIYFTDEAAQVYYLDEFGEFIQVQ